MAKETKTRVCPVCGKTYTEYPALSRRDNKTEICPQCGINEALEDYFNNKHKEEQKGKDLLMLAPTAL